MTIDELKEKIKECDKLDDEIKKLKEQQENILIELWNKKIEIAKVIKESGYLFTHPTINYTSSRGPILGLDKEENTLFVFSIGEGLLQVYLYSEKSQRTSWRKLVELGLFEEAYNGLKYLDKMIDIYIKNNKEVIEKLKNQIKKC